MHPYIKYPTTSFWSRSVAQNFAPSELTPPYEAYVRPGDRVVSAGSCFAANMIPYLERSGMQYLRTEIRPALFSDELAEEKFGYSKFSAGYGNIYTARQLLQLLRRCTGRFQPVEDAWVQNGVWIDPFRPGLAATASSEREYKILRAQHLSATLAALSQADVFVFTLGLTEAWFSRADGAVFPVCPGVLAGEYNEELHGFVNFGVSDVVSDLTAFVSELRDINPHVRLVLSVSPVPLVATATMRHVLCATTYSKSVLRVAAEEVTRLFDGIFYFPAYEIVTGIQAPDTFFQADLRSLNPDAIELVMTTFLAHCELPSGSVDLSRNLPTHGNGRELELSRSLIQAECEEAMTDAAIQEG